MDQFINGVVEPDSLPRAEEINFKPVERLYWKVLQWRWLLSCGLILLSTVLLLVFFTVSNTTLWISLLLALFVLFAVFYWLMRKSFLQKAYALRERDILYRSGWLITRVAVCPFNRIQH